MISPRPIRRIALAMTGASGAPYGLRLLECLLRGGHEVALMLSKPAQVVMGTETDWALPSRPADIRRFFCERFDVGTDRLQVYDREQWTAPVASGSSFPDAMVVCPCTTGTLSSIACGNSRNLIERAADVCLKERRQLILVVRETPLSEIHLENMLRLARMGAVMMPASPGFYHRPTDIAGLVDFMVARVLDHLDIEQTLIARWGQGGETAGIES